MLNHQLTNRQLAERFYGNHYAVFAVYWLMAFVLYLPAAKAGLVGDMPYLFEAIQKHGFWNFVNNKEGGALYQVAALNFYVLIRAFGTHVWLWHLFYVTVHAVNAILLFKFFSRLLADAVVDRSAFLAFAAVSLFVVSPHASEVVVWRASNHHSVATIIIFLVLICIQKFLREQKKGYALLAGLLFFYSTFSHEFFYLTPWFALLLILFYRFALHTDGGVTRKALLYFFVPTLLLFAMHLVMLRMVKLTFISHFGKLEQMSLFFYLEKPLKYLFHVLFMGRFFSPEQRHAVYDFCGKKVVIVAFYTLLTAFWGYVLIRLRQVSGKLKVLGFVTGCLIMVYLFLSPVYFADSMLVCYDRYVYPSLGFASLLVVLLLSLITVRGLQLALIAAYFALNAGLALKVNIYWKQSAYVIRHLLDGVPDPGNKTVLLLNLPDDLNGVPMIQAEDDGRFSIMLHQLTPHHVSNKMYDVVAYNMASMKDGAHVMVVNDSVCHITLNQWGTWWLYSMLGATSYQNADYKVNMIDEGHWYELTLKHPADGYLLLFQTGAEWKVVDWNKKNTDQY